MATIGDTRCRGGMEQVYTVDTEDATKAYWSYTGKPCGKQEEEETDRNKKASDKAISRAIRQQGKSKERGSKFGVSIQSELFK